MRRRNLPARLLAAFAVWSIPVPLAAQVIQNPPVTRAPSELRLAQPLRGDLVITQVNVVLDGMGAIVAMLQIKNIGQAPVTIPGGTVLARGEVQGGTITFPAQKVAEGFALHPGTLTSFSVPSAGWCPAGKPGAVTFRINPDNILPESDTGNNTFAVPASALTGDIRSPQVWVESLRFPPVTPGVYIDPAQRNTLPRGVGASIVVSFQNGGPGFVVVCPGQPVLRDVQSPVSAMTGLKTYSSPIGDVVRPGSSTQFKLIAAVPPIVLEPGSYPWQWLLNPQAVIAESSAANNAASTTVRVTPPIP